jgi:acetyl esterase/lipase
LLGSESVSGSIPATAQGWRILYSTKTSNGDPAIGSALVLASKNLPSGPRPVILWDHGTVGIARPCAPSLFKDFTNGVPAVPQVLARGWVMVAPDYVGMGTKGPTPYLIGTGQAYSALDAARAAHRLEELSLSNQTVVWGHSQGGNAALWTGHLAPSYAPQLKIVGVAALSPATDLVPLAESVQHAAAGTVVTGYVITAYSNTYNDVRFDDYVRPGARAQVRNAARRCLTDPGLAASVIAASGGESIFGKNLASGPLGRRLRQNTPTADMGGAPLLVAQGTGDEVISIKITENWVPEQCAAGYKLDFRKYPGLTHMGVLAAKSPLTEQLTRWTADRFAGKPAPNTC